VLKLGGGSPVLIFPGVAPSPTLTAYLSYLDNLIKPCATPKLAPKHQKTVLSQSDISQSGWSLRPDLTDKKKDSGLSLA
jgi:hypothetical protein